VTVARSKAKIRSRAFTPDELIKTSKDGRIRLIEKRKPRVSRTRRKSA
jgi:hypothetical protein